MTKGKSKIPYDRDATSTLVRQLITATLKISLKTTQISDVGKGSTGNLANRREPVLVDRPNY